MMVKIRLVNKNSENFHHLCGIENRIVVKGTVA
jgi:hypothetical protein